MTTQSNQEEEEAKTPPPSSPPAYLAMFSFGFSDPKAATPQTPATQVVQVVQIPATPSQGVCRYNGLKADLVTPNPYRKAPPKIEQMARNGELHVGDVAYFSGNHAEMCVSIDPKTGKTEWCSDKFQGTNFYVNDKCQRGTVAIFRCNDPNYDGVAAADKIMRARAPNYTHWCAHNVRCAEEQALGHGVLHFGKAADYLDGKNQQALKKAGFTQVV